MSIKPLDLQALFLKLGEVSREQANIKIAASNQRAAASREVVNTEVRKSHSVSEAEEIGSDEKVRERQEKQEEKRSPPKEREGLEDKREMDPKKRPRISEPELGQNVDLSL